MGATGSAEGGGIGFGKVGLKTGATTGDLEQTPNGVGVRTFSAHAGAPLRDIKFAPADFADPGEDPGLFGGLMSIEPIGEEGFYLVGQPEDDHRGGFGPGFGGGLENRRDFGFGEAWDDGGDHDAHGDAGVGEATDGFESCLLYTSPSPRDRG